MEYYHKIGEKFYPIKDKSEYNTVLEFMRESRFELARIPFNGSIELFREFCSCECHVKGSAVLHFMPCCKNTGDHYINEDGTIDDLN